MKTPNSYQIQVHGHFDNALAEWFAPLSIANQPNGDTTLSGPVRDQAELYGILLKLYNLNFTLISVQRIQANPQSPDNSTRLGIPDLASSRGLPDGCYQSPKQTYKPDTLSAIVPSSIPPKEIYHERFSQCRSSILALAGRWRTLVVL